ncbi:hypothetical protein KAR63_08170 [Weissella uvarum]|nr:hypothetical protein [Weissella uvarum]
MVTNQEMTLNFLNDVTQDTSSYLPINGFYFCATDLNLMMEYLAIKLRDYVQDITFEGQIIFDPDIVNMSFDEFFDISYELSYFARRNREFYQEMFNLVKYALAGYTGIVLSNDNHSAVEQYLSRAVFAMTQAALDVTQLFYCNDEKYRVNHDEQLLTLEEKVDIVSFSFSTVNLSFWPHFSYVYVDNDDHSHRVNEEAYLDPFSMFEAKDKKRLMQYYSPDLVTRDFKSLNILANFKTLKVRAQINHNADMMAHKNDPSLDNLVVAIDLEKDSDEQIAQSILGLLTFNFSIKEISEALGLSRYKINKYLTTQFGDLNIDEMINQNGDASIRALTINLLNRADISDLNITKLYESTTAR